MRRILVAAVLFFGLMSGCGDGSKTVTSGDEPTTTAADCNAKEKEEDPTDYNSAEGQAVGAKQGDLRHDIERLQEYGHAHPEEFTSVAFDNYPTVKTVAYFTGHLDEHRVAIEPLLEHADQFEIRQSIQSDRDAQQIMQLLNEDPRAGVDGTGWGPHSDGVVWASLGTTHAARDVADELIERFGKRVCIDLAGHPYPKGSRPDSSQCPKEPLRSDRNPDVDLRVVPEKTTLHRGERGSGVVRITNRGRTAIDTTTGSHFEGQVLLPHTNEIVGAFFGFSNMSAMLIQVAPGETKEYPLRFSTNDCRKDSDYSLPHGEYVVSTYLKDLGRSDDVTITIVE